MGGSLVIGCACNLFPFYLWTVTCNNSWIYCYDIEAGIFIFLYLKIPSLFFQTNALFLPFSHLTSQLLIICMPMQAMLTSIIKRFCIAREWHLVLVSEWSQTRRTQWYTGTAWTNICRFWKWRRIVAIYLHHCTFERGASNVNTNTITEDQPTAVCTTLQNVLISIYTWANH